MAVQWELEMDGRRASNGRWRDASAQTALVRVAAGRYRTYAELAADMGVGEITCRDWMAWWRDAWGVRMSRDDLGVFVIDSSGAVDLPRLRAWVESGHCFTGAERYGRRIEAGHVPWVDREWSDEVQPGARARAVEPPPFVYVPPAKVVVVKGPDGPLDDDDLPL